MLSDYVKINAEVRDMNKKISIVVPCYNEFETVELFYNATTPVLEEIGYDYEIIYINDGSKDKTIYKLTEMVQTKSHMTVIDFSRNFGKEAAMYAGLQQATGDYVVVMDVDLQDPPHMLKEMIKGIEEEGYDVVGTRRISRDGEPPIRSFFARQFYKIINKFIDVEIVDGARDYRMMRRNVVDAILNVTEYNRFSKGIFAWVGFKTKYLEYKNVERVAGETSWSFWKLLKYAIEGIVAFTTAPLQIATILGLLISVFAFLYMIVVFVKALIFGDPVAGYPSMMVVITLLGGIQLLCLGVLGEYIAKMYMEVKKRPVYIVNEVISSKKE